MIWKKIKDLWYTYAVMIVLGFIMIGITYIAVVHPMILADMEFDRVYDDAVDDLKDNDHCSDDFKARWVAALKHFKVLWNSGNNMTAAVIE